MIGRRYEGFPDERWLDIRRFHSFAEAARSAASTICARKGFDAVEPDNLAGWENKTGFPHHRAPTSSASTAGSPARSTPAGWRWR